MKLTFSDKAREAGEQQILLDRATDQLEEVLAEDSPLVEARWDRKEDESGKPVFVLHLKDSYGEVKGDITLSELESKNMTYFRLYLLRANLVRLEIKQRLQSIAGN